MLTILFSNPSNLVNMLTKGIARQTHNAEGHWRAVGKVIAYLKTKYLGIVFVKDGDFKLLVYRRASRPISGGCLVSRVAVIVGGTVVNASSTAQHCVMLSTSEAQGESNNNSIETITLLNYVLTLPPCVRAFLCINNEHELQSLGHECWIGFSDGLSTYEVRVFSHGCIISRVSVF